MGKLADASEYDTDLIGDLDAGHWAERFVHHCGANPAIARSEDTMRSWFASCIEGTRDAVTGQALGKLANVQEVQGRDGNWDWSPYMRGLYNGLVLARAVVGGTVPASEYRDEPADGYREDRVDPQINEPPSEVPGA